MKKLVMSAIAVGGFVVLVLVLDGCRMNSIEKRAARVKVGATRADVTSQLGKPRQVATRLFGSGETWAYGRFLDLRRPYFPIRIRILAPDEDDVAIMFNSQGEVTEVRLPKN